MQGVSAFMTKEERLPLMVSFFGGSVCGSIGPRLRRNHTKKCDLFTNCFLNVYRGLKGNLQTGKYITCHLLRKDNTTKKERPFKTENVFSHSENIFTQQYERLKHIKVSTLKLIQHATWMAKLWHCIEPKQHHNMESPVHWRHYM